MFLIHKLKVLDVELYLGATTPVVLLELVTQVETVGTHTLQAFSHLEGYGRIGSRTLGDGDGVKLQVIRSHNAGSRDR